MSPSSEPHGNTLEGLFWFYADSCGCFLSHISFSTLNIDPRKINVGLTED